MSNVAGSACGRKCPNGVPMWGAIVPTILKKLCELVHRESRLSNESPEGSFGQFVMVGNGEPPVRRVGASENDVAAVLPIEFVSELSECGDCLAARNHRQLHPLETSMTSSRILG